MLEIKATKLSAGEVAVIKLISGEEIIGRVKNIGSAINDTGEITLTKVGTIGLQQNPQNGQVTVAMGPYMVGADSDGDFTFTADKYIVVMPAAKQAADMYTQQTSGILPATKTPDLSGIDLSKLST